MRWTQADLDAYESRNKNRRAVQAAVMEHCDAPTLHRAKPEAQDRESRIVVRIKSIRKRLLDPDNLHCKDIIDGLRDFKLIPDDSAKFIILEVTQEKGAEDLTEITICYP